jgi:hypothetical protein
VQYKIQIDFKTDRELTDEEMAYLASYMSGRMRVADVGEGYRSSDITLKIKPVVETNVAVDIERSDWTCPAR